MVDSTADTTEANADTPRLELHKVLKEFFYDGVGKDRGETEESPGFLKAIDDAVTRILDCLNKVEPKKELHKVLKEIFYDGVGGGGGGNKARRVEAVIKIMGCLREVQSKNPSVLEVPKEFICSLSKKIMIEPMLISSGQTYEKKNIKEWMKHNNKCPKTKQVISTVFLTPNHLLNEMITQWCRVNKVDRPKPSVEIVTELSTADIEPLLQRISSSSSVSDQIEAAKELVLQTSKFINVRAFFVTKIPVSITRLLTPLTILGNAVDSNPEFLENIFIALFNISTFDKSKTLLAENPHVLPLLAKTLKQGTVLTRHISASTLNLLSDVDSTRIIIGNSEALKALIDLIQEGGRLLMLTTYEAICAVYSLCLEVENREKAISLGLAPAVIKKIKAGRIVEESLTILQLISPHERVIEEMDNLGVIIDLISILRKPSSLLNGEKALEIVYNLYARKRESSSLKILAEEDKLHGTFTKLASQGSARGVIKAQEILRWIRVFL